VVQSLTSRRHSGHGSANATRNNTKAKDQTTIAKASKASSEYHTMEGLISRSCIGYNKDQVKVYFAKSFTHARVYF
jgi:hypothetical protein